jgi:hypothetical protein
LLPVPQGLDQINSLVEDAISSWDQDLQQLHRDQEELSSWEPSGSPLIPSDLNAQLIAGPHQCATVLIRSRPWRLRCQNGQVLRRSGRILHDPSTDWPGLYGRSKVLWPARRQRGLVLNLTNHGTPNLYHWLFNPTLQLLRQLEASGLDATSASALYFGPAWPDPWPTYVEQTLSRLGLAALPRLRRAVWPEHLLMSVFASTSVCPSYAQFRWLRRHLAPVREHKGLRLYLGRALASRRRLLNERVLMASLEAVGFTCVPDPACLDFDQQCRLLAQADVVVAPHGAALSLLFCCVPGTKVLEIHGPGYVSPLYAWMASFGQLTYAALMAQPRANPAEPMMDDLWIDPQMVLDQLTQWGVV